MPMNAHLRRVTPATWESESPPAPSPAAVGFLTRARWRPSRHPPETVSCWAGRGAGKIPANNKCPCAGSPRRRKELGTACRDAPWWAAGNAWCPPPAATPAISPGAIPAPEKIGGDVVSDYALVVAGGDDDRLHEALPHGPGDRQGDVCHR